MEIAICASKNGINLFCTQSDSQSFHPPCTSNRTGALDLRQSWISLRDHPVVIGFDYPLTAVILGLMLRLFINNGRVDLSDLHLRQSHHVHRGPKVMLDGAEFKVLKLRRACAMCAEAEGDSKRDGVSRTTKRAVTTEHPLPNHAGVRADVARKVAPCCWSARTMRTRLDTSLIPQ